MALNASRTLLKAKGLARKGDIDAAVQLFAAVLKQFPQNKEAILGLASMSEKTSQVPQASVPASRQDLENLVRLFNGGHLQQALDAGRILAIRHRGEPLIHNVVGAVYKSLHQYDNAIASFTQAVRLKPDYAEAYNNLGAACHDVGRYDDAVFGYSKAIEHDAGFFEAYCNLGSALAESGRPKDAIGSYLRAVRIKPDCAETAAKLLFQLAEICDWDGIASNAAAIRHLGIAHQQVLPVSLLHLEDHPGRHRQRSELYSNTMFENQQPALILHPEVKPRRLRVGYFSADFHDHDTMYQMARLFELHDPDAFETIVYSYGVSAEDSMRSRLIEAVDEFYDVRDLSDADVAALCRTHRLDVAVDLMGCIQRARLGIFSYRAAPIQISYLGYPGTTGASFIDYIIADEVVIPREQGIHYCEQIIYLPHSYQAKDDTREISDKTLTRTDVGLPEAGFVFCCFNASCKISQKEFDIWMRLLQQVEDSVLWLFSSNEWAQANLLTEAQKRGVAPERIIFSDRVSHADHLARYQLADVFLDTFNYTADTQASDALWAGLPLITRLGWGFPARVAGSLLTAIDLPELITNSESEYEQLALDLAQNPERLAALKEKLAENRLTAPLFNPELFTQHIEEAYQQAYQRYFDGEPLSLIVVQP
ncbi:MAG: tetratricopeptide repeat protein [Halioglobus sp.]